MSLTSLDLGGGGNSFQFETIGDSVTGKVVGLSEVQQTDMDSGQPATWENGQPKMMVAVELQTQLRDPSNPADDGKRTVYLKGSKKAESMSSLAAVLVAVRNASGATTLNVGGTLTLTYAGDGVPSRRGYNAPKQYTAQYQAPAVNLMGEQPGQAASSPAAAQQAAPPAQPDPSVTAAAQNVMAGMSPDQLAEFQRWQAGQPQASQQV